MAVSTAWHRIEVAEFDRLARLAARSRVAIATGVPATSSTDCEPEWEFRVDVISAVP